jgi:hypothetical protein
VPAAFQHNEPTKEQSSLVQWNTTTIRATRPLEEALAKADELPAIF